MHPGPGYAAPQSTTVLLPRARVSACYRFLLDQKRVPDAVVLPVAVASVLHSPSNRLPMSLHGSSDGRAADQVCGATQPLPDMSDMQPGVQGPGHQYRLWP